MSDGYGRPIKPLAPKRLSVRTPLVESTPLSTLSGYKVFCKLETAQVNSCFKIRGISNLMIKALEHGYTKFVSSSGGNAGMAAAYTARQLGTPIKVIVPSTTPEFMRKRLRDERAEVIVHGDAWDHAHALAEKEAQQPGVFAVHPFNHPDIWAGHASLIQEIKEDLPSKPDLVITSVGGGGLALGLLEGMNQAGWADVPLLCMETIGADCFNKALEAGKIVTLPKISSIANCLGALTVATPLFEAAQTRPILSEVVSDAEAIQAIIHFLDDHKMLVEPACSAALAAVYAGTVRKLVEVGKLKNPRVIVVIICGGLSVNLEYLEKWKKQFGLV